MFPVVRQAKRAEIELLAVWRDLHRGGVGRRLIERVEADLTGREHARRINAADLSYPVILAADGSLMDCGHRIAKAYLLGEHTVQARRFVTDPEPDWIVPDDSN